MKRFRFSLERVLEFRRRQEERERERLAALAAEQARLEREADLRLAEARSLRAACSAATVLPSLEVKLAYDSSAALRRARERTLERAEAAEESRRRQLEAVLRARRQVRLLELLRDRRRGRHRRLEDREQELLAEQVHRCETARTP